MAKVTQPCVSLHASTIFLCHCVALVGLFGLPLSLSKSVPICPSLSQPVQVLSQSVPVQPVPVCLGLSQSAQV